MKKRLITTITVLMMVIGLVGINTNSINAEDTTDYLCFTAEEANSTIKLTKNGDPMTVNLEYKLNDGSWNAYNIDDVITLANVYDEVYFRNTSSTTTYFSKEGIGYYKFVMTGKIAASGDVTTLININGTIDLNEAAFLWLFADCTSLTSTPKLPATTLTDNCYLSMFENCTNLIILPDLPATNLTDCCYYHMFDNCTGIKISNVQDSDYTIPITMPSSGSITTRGIDDVKEMFLNAGGSASFTTTGTPIVNDGVITLYLKPCDVTITYDGNGNTGGSVPSSSTYTILDEATVKGNENSLTKTGKVFAGWSLRPDGNGKVYNPGDTFNIRGDMTLYARWEDPNYSFTSGSGQTYTKGTLENKLFICDGPLANLTFVKVDDVEITETTQYTKESGSTKITLLGSYLETLGLGSHTLKLTYSDGPTPTVTFNVVNPSIPEPEPTPAPSPNNNAFVIPNTGIIK